MASISIMVTNNENGVINNSFSFSEEEIKRITAALGSIYQPTLQPPPIPNPNGEMVDQEYLPSAVDIFSVLSQALVSHIINTCREEEVNRELERIQNSLPNIPLRGQ